MFTAILAWLKSIFGSTFRPDFDKDDIAILMEE